MTRAISFTVPGRPIPLPRTTQRKKWADPAWQRYLAWRDAVAWQAKAAGVRPLAGPVRVAVAFWLPDRRRADLDNLVKGVLDALTGVAWEDDSQVVRLVAGVERGARDAMAAVEIAEWTGDAMGEASA